MNIFVTSPDPIACAQALDDKRVVKMVLESAQMLSTAVYMHLHKTPETLYKPTHEKHPCTIWAAETQGNYQWLLDHMVALGDEYHLRYHKDHKSIELVPVLLEYKEIAIPQGKRTAFVNCARAADLGIDFTSEEDVFKAYQHYLKSKWQIDKREPMWTERGQPDWTAN